ncbi:MAG: hypothetical protein VKN72_21980 [Nostocales cyanobacterium 94392]|nr:hypothetical protein [Nostocales cyanobacterium 94392]
MAWVMEMGRQGDGGTRGWGDKGMGEINHQPSTNNQQPSTNNHQPLTSNL